MKKNYIYALKILMALAVIYNHQLVFDLFFMTNGMKQIFYLFASIIVRAAVPVFFLCSGATIFQKQRTIKWTITKAFYILFLLSVSMFIMYLQESLFSGKKLVLIDYLNGVRLGKGPFCFPYWFLYTYMGMIFMVPFLYYIVHSISEIEFNYLLVLSFIILTIIPTINVIMKSIGRDGFQLSGSFDVALVTSKSCLYPIIGYYLDNREKYNMKKVGVVLFVSIVYSSLLTKISISLSHSYDLTVISTKVTDYIVAATIFILIKGIVESHSNAYFNTLLAGLGGVTTGVYLFDQFYKRLIYQQFECYLEPKLPTFIVDCIWCIISFTLGSLTWKLLLEVIKSCKKWWRKRWKVTLNI